MWFAAQKTTVVKGVAIKQFHRKMKKKDNNLFIEIGNDSKANSCTDE